MRLAASLPVQPRWFFVAVLLAVFGALPAVRAQTPAGTYGVELRGAGDGSRVEARVGPDTAKPETRRTAIVVPKSPQPFTVKWSAREVSVTIGGQSIRYAATWRIGNAVRIAARGNVRASIGVVGGRRVDKMVFDDLVVAGANLSKSWTLEGAIDWPDEPTPADVLTVTSTTQDQATPGTDPKDRKTFTGGVADSSILVSPVAGAPLTAPRVASRFGARASLSGVERTWNGGDGLWSNPNNWDPRGVPQNGDIATFSPGSGNSFRTTNDLTPSPALGGLNVRNGNLQIQGNGVTLLPGSQSELERDTSVDLLNGGGTIEIANNRVFTVGRQGQPTPVATSLFSGTITGDKGTLVKDGPGAITFTGDASGIQETDIKQGDFFLNGGSLSDVVATGPNQTLSMANAHVGSLNVRNDGEMGDARSRVATTGDVQMEGMSYVQTIAGPDDFQKLITTGTVRLSHNGRSRLTVQLTGGYVPNLGAQFIMIDNDGTDPVDGTFDGLPEGAFINLGGVVFRLSYAAGTGNDIGLTVVQSGARPDLTIAKTKSGSFNAGETGTFTLTVTNVGTAPTARTATVTDTLPAGFAPQTASGPGWGCNISSQQVSCSRGDALAAGASYPDIAIGVLVAQNAPDATNTASVRVDGDQNTANDTASVSVIVGRVIDLAILKKHLTAFKQGGTGTYVIGVSNPGTTASSGLVTVTDALPSGLTPTSAAGPGWTCNVSAPTVTCTRSNSLAPGASFDPIQIGVSIASNAPASVANIATLSGGGDTTPANNTSTDVTPIAQVTPDLTIAKAQVESQFVPGQTGHFTIKVSNGGTGSTNGTVTVSDVLAASLAQPVAIGSGWSCGTSVQTITCTRPDALAAGGDYPPITITVQVAASPGQPSNTATVSGGGDVNQNNNSITIPVNISNIGPADQPDLFVTKDQTGVVAQGGTISFAITVGNSATAGLWSGTVTLTDSLPAGLTQPIGSGQGWSCNNGQAVTCTRSGDLAAGTSYPMLTIAANVSPTATSDTNRVTITAPNDSNLANNIAEKSYTVLARSANLTIAKSNTGPFTPGQSASFTITVTNNGPVPTTGTVNVDDVVPPGLTPTSVTASGWTCPVAQHVTCTRGDPLAAGASYAPITILASVALGAQSGENSAVVSGGGDTTPDDNTAISAFVVTGSPNLSLTKTHTGNFTVGQQGAQYQIVARNAGTAQTIGPVTVDDTIPLGLTPTGASGAGWACTIAAQLVECTRGDNLAAGQSWPTITIVVNVGTTVGTLNNTATVSGGGDANPNDNSVVDSTIISGQPQLTIVKTHADPVIQGAPDLPFTIVVSNNGTAQTAGTVTVTDPLPGGLTPTSASGPGWACSIAGATVTCTRSDALAAAADYPALQIRASVAPTATTVTNIAAVAGGGDTTPADNTFSDPVPISPAGQPNLAITKRHDGNFFQGQQNATYRLRIANVGVAPTSGTVTVSDDVPVGLTPATASGAGWSCSISSQHVQCSRGDSLGPGTVYPEIDLLCQVANNATDIVNVATVTGGGDQTPNDNSGSDTTHIAGRSPNLSVTKSHADPFLVGQQDASYQIAVANVGSAPTNGPVVVTDGIPAGLTPAAASGAGWTCTIAGQTVTCQRSDSLAAGAAYPAITLRVSVLAGASNLSNVVTVSGGGDTTPDNNTAVDATSINVSPDATISLGPTSPLVVADTAEYQSVVSNLGPGWIGGQTTVVATFPTDLIPVFGHGDGWQCQTSGQQVSCQRVSSLGPNTAFAPLRFRVMVRLGPSAVTVAARVNNSADNNTANNVAVSDTQTVLPTTGLTIDQKTTTPSVAVGGTAAYQVTVVNTGQARLEHVVLQDLLPRGFVFAAATHTAASSQRTVLNQAVTVTNGLVSWPLGTLNAGEAVTLNYQAIVGADARSGLQETRASVSADDLRGDTVQAGPAIVTVDVTTEVFTMLQAIVGRVFEDVDGNGMFGGGDRPIANARVITSTGQAALTDEAGLYNIPSIGSGTVAVSLDRDTIPSGLTVIDGPGGRSWTRLLRTPIGGGSLLTQNFALERAAGATATAAAPVTPPDAADVNRVPDDPAAGSIPPRRDYESRQGSSLFIGLGEVSFGRAAQEFELFQKDKDVWGYGSVFYQGPLVSAKNRLTFAVDSRRHLNGTTDQDRLFELDPNDRMYPVFGDSSRRQEFATANSHVFARVERGASHVMWGDLIGDLPSSATDGGRWSSYQRHLTGFEVRVADKAGDHVTVRAAQPKTAYARDVFAGGSLGLMSLSHTEVLAGTETIALEIRDRRMPDRLLERDVLARGVDYQLEPGSGTVFLQRNVSGIDPQLNLVQIVATYEYENLGLEHMVFNGRAAGTYKSVRGGVTFFTEEGLSDTRFTVFGLDVAQSLPRGGRWRVDLPFSHGTPNVASSVDARPVDAGADTDGWAIQGEVEQPFQFWSGVLHASFLHADDNFRNPFSATITPGAGYFNANAALAPRKPSRVTFGVTYERYNTAAVDASRTTLSAEWAETIGRHLTLKAGYDGRSLDENGTNLDSGLFTGQAIVRVGDRFEARAAREQNVRNGTDPTYPDQTLLGARWKTTKDTSLFYTQRISDSAIVPIGDFASTGFSQLNTKGELNVGVESRVADTTQLTSGYRVEQGLNGPDGYAMLGVLTHVKLGHDLGTSFGLEHGQLVSGPDGNYTSGSLAVDWRPSDRFKATTRYEGRDRGGYESLFTAGAAARLYSGFTGLTRLEWTNSDRTTIGDAKAFLAAVALRPLTNDRVGWLLSYQYVDGGAFLPTVAPGRANPAWQHLLSTDGYVQPIQWLELHGKFAWQRTDPAFGLITDTYLSQLRAQAMFSKRFDAALEQRYIWQPASDSHRNGTALELGFWPIADARVALGYNFNDSRDPYGRDLQGRDKGVYVTLSTKLSYLFDLFGSKPPAAVQR